MTDTLNMDEVVRRLNDAGVDAYVEQTGGGCATIFAGVQSDERWDVCAGPGWFEGPGWTNARGDLGDFAIGPDDDGDSDPNYTDASWTEDQVFNVILLAVGAGGWTKREEK